jgi:hypothetical protein
MRKCTVTGPIIIIGYRMSDLWFESEVKGINHLTFLNG